MLRVCVWWRRLGEKLSEMDEGTASLIQGFFDSYGGAVRSVAGERTRAHLAEASLLPPPEEGGDEGGRSAVPGSVGEPLERAALRWLSDHEDVSTVLVGLTSTNHVGTVRELTQRGL